MRIGKTGTIRRTQNSRALTSKPLNFGQWTLDRLPLSKDPLGGEPFPGTSMKKILTAITAALFVLSPALSFSSYIIHLKDGTKFVADRYDEEGDHIKFKRYGGVIGIQEGLVMQIEEIKNLQDEQKAMAKQAAYLTAEKGSVRRNHSRIRLIGLMP